MGMPSKAKIKKHWAETIIKIKDYDSRAEFFEGDFCFACGWEVKTERCHILAKVEGGEDTEKNLHLLCSSCHYVSEMKSAEDYWEWLKGWNSIKRVYAEVMRRSPEKAANIVLSV